MIRYEDYSADWPFAPTDAACLRTMRRLLDTLTREGVRYRVVAGVFRADGNAANIGAHRHWINANRRGLTLTLLLENKLCLDCRTESANRRIGNGIRCEACYWRRVRPGGGLQITGAENGEPNTGAEKSDCGEKPTLTLI